MKIDKSKLPSRHTSVGVQKAPKYIVARERKALIDYKIELKKLNSILNSIKN